MTAALAEERGILDTRNTIGIPTFDGTDGAWDAWRTKFEAYADLADLGEHMEIAEKQSRLSKILQIE